MTESGLQPVLARIDNRKSLLCSSDPQGIATAFRQQEKVRPTLSWLLMAVKTVLHPNNSGH